MTKIVFDTSSIISIMTNNLMDIMIKLKQESNHIFEIIEKSARKKGCEFGLEK